MTNIGKTFLFKAFAVGEADENLVLRVPQQRRRLLGAVSSTKIALTLWKHRMGNGQACWLWMPRGRKCYTKSAYARVAQDICLHI